MVGEIRKDLQGSAFGLMEVPSWHWGNEKNHKKPW